MWSGRLSWPKSCWFWICEATLWSSYFNRRGGLQLPFDGTRPFEFERRKVSRTFEATEVGGLGGFKPPRGKWKPPMVELFQMGKKKLGDFCWVWWIFFPNEIRFQTMRICIITIVTSPCGENAELRSCLGNTYLPLKTSNEKSILKMFWGVFSIGEQPLHLFFFWGGGIYF